MIRNGQTMNKLAVIFIIFVLVFSPAGIVFYEAEGKGSGSYPPPDNGDWVITNKTVVRNETIHLNGNLTIEPGGNLTLINCTLIFNCSFDGQYHIEVKSGSELHVIGRKEEGEPEETIWYTKITTTGEDTFDFVVREVEDIQRIFPHRA